jgi:two-component system OmpR family sensor kinase
MTLVVTADRDRIQQVFTNLIGNIDRYTPAGSPVELALGVQDGQAVAEFRDHGPGIAPKDQDRVFERFYRAEDSRARATGGTGVGLAIVAGIMSAHHGAASISRTRGGGLTVRVALPLTQPAAPSSPSPAATRPEPDFAPIPGETGAAGEDQRPRGGRQ